MPIDPQAQAVLDQLAASGAPPMHTLPVAEARQSYLSTRITGGTPESVSSVENREIAGPGGNIPIRIYTPEGMSPFPVLVYFHGGGWVLGNLETHDHICRALTNAAGCITVAVDYRLAPEHKYPAAVEDCYAATLWASTSAATFNGDSRRIAVGGDSAGGNLAGVVALLARDLGVPPLVYQLLVYPVTDHYQSDKPSYRENAEGYLLTADAMRWFWDHYLSDESAAKHPHASPLQAKDLGNLPPALVITAEFDPLRDEGELYAARLRDSGVAVTSTRYNGMIHGFFSMAAVIDQGKQALAQAAAGLRSAFGNR